MFYPILYKISKYFSSRVQIPPPKCRKYLFYVALTDKKHNIVELNSCVVLLFLILYNVIKGDEKMFEKHFNRSYETHDFPYFVPEKESLATRYLKP